MKDDVKLNEINVVPSIATLTNHKIYIECPKCGGVAVIDSSIVLTSYPPQYEWFCPDCGAHGYIHCDEVKSIDPAIFKKTRARYTTYCKICGDEILVYGDEKPTICKNCKEAVIAMRKALGTWHD
jgi:transcription elongation factor Elf1